MKNRERERSRSPAHYAGAEHDWTASGSGTDGRIVGLRKLNATVERPDNPSIRGMVTKIRHLVEVEELPAASEPAGNGNPEKNERKARSGRIAPDSPMGNMIDASHT